jgi:hypothetical protein
MRAVEEYISIVKGSVLCELKMVKLTLRKYRNVKLIAFELNSKLFLTKKS